MNTKLFIGIIIFIICCILAFLIPNAFKTDDCNGGACPPLTERRIVMEWYWMAAVVAALAGLFYWFFVRVP